MQNKDLGLDKENVVSVYTSLWYNVAGFKQELLRNPNVKSISMGAPIEARRISEQCPDVLSRV